MQVWFLYIIVYNIWTYTFYIQSKAEKEFILKRVLFIN